MIYLPLYKFSYLPVPEANGSVYFLDDLGLALHVGNEIIEGISCDNELLYKGRNLIGMDIQDFISHTDDIYRGEIDELDFEDDNIPQFVYEFGNIGLQV